MGACTHPQIDLAVKYGEISLWHCSLCQLIFQRPAENQLLAKDHYANYYKLTGQRFGPIMEWVVKCFRLWRAMRLRYYLGRPISSALDVGCGRGYTLWYLKKYFGTADALGIQPAASAAEFARTKLGLKVIAEDVQAVDLPPNHFQVITMWHVLEHLPEPGAVLDQLNKALSVDGRLFIEVPNYNSWTRAITKEYWLGLDLDNHLIFFTPNSLADLLHQTGFVIKRQRTFSAEYSTFFSAESLASLVSGEQHGLLRRLEGQPLTVNLFLHAILTLILLLPCLIINVILVYTSRGEVIFVEAEKNN